MGLFDFFKKKRLHVKSEDIEPVDHKQLEFIDSSMENAERIVQSFNDRYEGAFDYLESSLKALDELIENFAEFADQMDEEMKADFIAQAGSYVFEVARRTYGGKYYWYYPLDQPVLVTGQPSFEISFLAFEKIKNRLENGI